MSVANQCEVGRDCEHDQLTLVLRRLVQVRSIYFMFCLRALTARTCIAAVQVTGLPRRSVCRGKWFVSTSIPDWCLPTTPPRDELQRLPVVVVVVSRRGRCSVIISIAFSRLTHSPSDAVSTPTPLTITVAAEPVSNLVETILTPTGESMSDRPRVSLHYSHTPIPIQRSLFPMVPSRHAARLVALGLS